MKKQTVIYQKGKQNHFLELHLKGGVIFEFRITNYKKETIKYSNVKEHKAFKRKEIHENGRLRKVQYVLNQHWVHRKHKHVKELLKPPPELFRQPKQAKLF